MNESNVSAITQFGFRFGAALVERYMSLPDGRVCVGVTTDAGRKLDIYVSRTGRSVRVVERSIDRFRRPGAGSAGQGHKDPNRERARMIYLQPYLRPFPIWRYGDRYEAPWSARLVKGWYADRFGDARGATPEEAIANAQRLVGAERV